MPRAAYLTCSNCQAPREVDPKGHSFTCSHCHKQYEAVRCGHCRFAYLTDTPVWTSSQCPSCGQVEKRRYSAGATLGDIKGLLAAEPRAPLRPAPSSAKLPSFSEYVAKRGGLVGRVAGRMWPIVASVLFVVAGLLYCFRWDSVVLHIPSCWVWPGDLWGSYRAASVATHGHFGSIYSFGFLEVPGILVALAPIAAWSGVLHTTFLEIATNNRQVPAYPRGYIGPGLVGHPVYHTSAGYFVAHPQWVLFVEPYALMISCASLFAFDALAERLGVSRPRRTVLCITEAVLLWNMTVRWGHPEDAVAVALAVYAFIFVLDGRVLGAGWLLGVALAFQPLVLLMAPILLAMAGRRLALGMAFRSVMPVAATVAVPLIANSQATLHWLVDQPSSPGLNHATPWTALSPNLGGGLVAAGPIRIVGLTLAAGLGIWICRRSVTRPELLAWSCALGLALRSYTESVMTPYYPWAALAVGVVVAARCTDWRFVTAIGVAVTATVLGEQRLGWLPWWTIQMAALAALLAVAARPKAFVRATAAVEV